MSQIRRVAIIGGNRIPFMRSNTAYSNASNMDMLSATLQGLVERFGLEGQRLGEVAAGAVMKHSRDFNLAREATLNSGLALETPPTIFSKPAAPVLKRLFWWPIKLLSGKLMSALLPAQIPPATHLLR